MLTLFSIRSLASAYSIPVRIHELRTEMTMDSVPDVVTVVISPSQNSDDSVTRADAQHRASGVAWILRLYCAEARRVEVLCREGDNVPWLAAFLDRRVRPPQEGTRFLATFLTSDTPLPEALPVVNTYLAQGQAAEEALSRLRPNTVPAHEHLSYETLRSLWGVGLRGPTQDPPITSDRPEAHVGIRVGHTLCDVPEISVEYTVCDEVPSTPRTWVDALVQDD